MQHCLDLTLLTRGAIALSSPVSPNPLQEKQGDGFPNLLDSLLLLLLLEMNITPITPRSILSIDYWHGLFF